MCGIAFGVHEAQLALYPFFNSAGGFHVEALGHAIDSHAGSRNSS